MFWVSKKNEIKRTRYVNRMNGVNLSKEDAEIIEKYNKLQSRITNDKLELEKVEKNKQLLEKTYHFNEKFNLIKHEFISHFDKKKLYNILKYNFLDICQTEFISYKLNGKTYYECIHPDDLITNKVCGLCHTKNPDTSSSEVFDEIFNTILDKINN